MKIENMKDFKEVLSKIPNNVLEHFAIAVGDDGFGFGCTEGDGELDMSSNFKKYADQFPQVKTLHKFFDNLVEAVVKKDFDVGYITSE